MARVTIKGYRYYRRSRRVGGKVMTEHVGAARVAEPAAQLDTNRRRFRVMEGSQARLAHDAFLIGIEDALAVDEVLRNPFALLAGRCGAYRHRRQWRFKRRADVMGSLRGMLNDVKRLAAEIDRAEAARPLMAPEFDGIPDDDRAVLRAAAKGDAAALEKARPYLTDRRYIARWGSPMYVRGQVLARRPGVRGRQGGRPGYPQPGGPTAGRTRVSGGERPRAAGDRAGVHNWLMVGVLEVKACGWKPFTKEQAQIERYLSQAERRLLQAVKTLAFLRRCHPAEVAGRLPAAVATVPPPAVMASLAAGPARWEGS